MVRRDGRRRPCRLVNNEFSYQLITIHESSVFRRELDHLGG